MWRYAEGNHRQTAYQIDVYHGESIIYTTGKVISNEQNNININPDLHEQTQYSFCVLAWDENDTMEQSERAYFVTGVHNWQGNWIGNGTKKPFIVRKSFCAHIGQQGILSVCVPGQFEVMINGRKITTTYEGSQTDFDRHIHYRTYDVSFGNEGENEITIEAANGWYIGDDNGGGKKRYFYTMDKGYKPFGECLAV